MCVYYLWMECTHKMFVYSTHFAVLLREFHVWMEWLWIPCCLIWNTLGTTLVFTSFENSQKLFLLDMNRCTFSFLFSVSFPCFPPLSLPHFHSQKKFTFVCNTYIYYIFFLACENYMARSFIFVCCHRHLIPFNALRLLFIDIKYKTCINLFFSLNSVTSILIVTVLSSWPNLYCHTDDNNCKLYKIWW